MTIASVMNDEPIPSVTSLAMNKTLHEMATLRACSSGSDVITSWTNESCCAYYAFRPRAPPDTPTEGERKYGTGNGAHNPIVCQSFIRYLCEEGAGEFSADDHLKKIIRSSVGIKPIV
jgi:hypothetical protein